MLTDTGVNGILLANLGAFGSGELKSMENYPAWEYQQIPIKPEGQFNRTVSVVGPSDVETYVWLSD